MKLWRDKTLCVLGAGLVVLAGMIWLLKPSPDRVSELLRQRGYPTTLAELDKWYPSVPPSENAALVYTNAFAQLKNPALPVTNLLIAPWLPPIGTGFTADERGQLAAYFEANREALRLLCSVSPSALSRYPLDLRQGYTLALPHLAQSRQAILLLTSQGLAQANDGDTIAATRSFLAAAGVAESFAEEPLLVSQRVRSMDWNILLARFERALNLATFSETELWELQARIQKAERPQAALRGWVTECVAAKSVFQDRRVRDSALAAQSMLAPKSSGAQLARLSPWLKDGCIGLLSFAGEQEKDKAFLLNYAEQRVRAMELAYPARFEAIQRLEAITNKPGRWCVFSQMISAAQPFLDCQDVDHTARIRTAATVIAVERFRLAHNGNLPASLSELVPDFLRVPLLDPFNGQPLIFQKQGTSYVVYSTGSDCKDDGGVAWDKNYTKSPRDIAVVVKR